MLLLWSAIFLVAVNTTILNPALPAIGADLHIRDAAFGWILGAYFAGFGALQLIGGRIADFQARRHLLIGSLLVYASCALICGTAMQLPMLIAARLCQGASGAIVWGIALSMVAQLHEPGLQRTRALGVCAFLSASGGSAGWLIGGSASQSAGWRYILLMTATLATVLAVLGPYVLRRVPKVADPASFSWGRALTITSTFLLFSLAILSLSASGWTAPAAWLLFSAAILSFAMFLLVQKRNRDPFLPRGTLTYGKLLMTAASAGLLGAAALLWSFASAIYLQQSRLFTSAELGFVMMPTNIVIAAVSLFVVPKVVERSSLNVSAVAGLVIAGLGLLCLATIPTQFTLAIIVELHLIAIGIGLAYNPLLLRMMELTPHTTIGAASGIFNTMYLLTGAFAVSTFNAIVALTYHPDAVVHASEISGAQYRLAFGIAAFCAAAAAVVTWVTRVRGVISTGMGSATTSN